MKTKTDVSRPFDQKPALLLVACLLVLGTIGLNLQRVAQAANVHPAQEKLEMIAGHEVAANRVIVKYRSTKSRTSLQSIAQTLDADVDVELGGTGARLVHSNSRTAAALLAELSQRS